LCRGFALSIGREAPRSPRWVRAEWHRWSHVRYRNIAEVGVVCRRIAVRLLGLGVVGLTLMGCDKSSSTCNNGSCEVTVSGKPEVNLNPKVRSGNRKTYGYSPTGRRRFKIVEYRGDAVTINSGAQTETVKIGETKTVNDLAFQVRSIDPNGHGAKLHVRFR
jgi:hypothetical protein